jgi:hypothetical protein
MSQKPFPEDDHSIAKLLAAGALAMLGFALLLALLA